MQLHVLSILKVNILRVDTGNSVCTESPFYETRHGINSNNKHESQEEIGSLHLNTTVSCSLKGPQYQQAEVWR